MIDININTPRSKHLAVMYLNALASPEGRAGLLKAIHAYLGEGKSNFHPTFGMDTEALAKTLAMDDGQPQLAALVDRLQGIVDRNEDPHATLGDCTRTLQLTGASPARKHYRCTICGKRWHRGMRDKDMSPSDDRSEQDRQGWGLP